MNRATIGRRTPALTPTEWLTAHAGAVPAELAVVGFLASMEERNFEALEDALAEGFTMTFPGPVEYKALSAMVKSAAARYRRIGKRIEVVESFTSKMEARDTTVRSAREVVYVRGTLYGVNHHGIEFSGVRFIDRFELEDGRFVRQDVWNDLAESGLLLFTR